MVQINYRTRSSIVFFLFCVLYAIMIANLYTIQIRQQDFYANLANKQYNVTVTQRPPRALILDRNGKPLALNKDALSAFIMPKMLKQPETLKKFLKKNYPKAYERLIKRPDAHFLFVKRHLGENETFEHEDIHILKEPSRYYPLRAAGPVVGLTDIDNNGLFGIELTFDKQLAGTPITYGLEKDARSGHFYFDKQVRNEGHEGQPIKLTIDRDIQFLAYEKIKEAALEYGAKSAAALIMDPTTGEILAAVQYPTFDTENIKLLDQQQTKLHVVTEAYELGSVIKAFLAIAALEERVVTPEEEIDCESTLSGYVHGMKVNTTFANGTIPFSDVLKKSNNIGVAKVAFRLKDKLYDHYRRLGFGTKTGITVLGEQSGFVNPPANWSNRSLISLSFGYEISASLLQLARAFGIIANHGYMVPPHMVLESNVDNLLGMSPVPRPDTEDGKNNPLYSPLTILQIRDILQETAAGTTKSLSHIPGLKVMGKTGTARLIVDGKYVENRNIYTFAGILEKGDYKRVIVTFIKEIKNAGVLASVIAAPVFVQIAQQLLIHDKKA